MIGLRAALSAGLALALAAGGLQGGDAGPGAVIAADRLVRDRASEADARLTALERALEPALAASRRGAARIVAGEASPAAAFAAAAAATREAEPIARDAAAALDDLVVALRAREPAADGVEAPLRPGQLASIADQLDATAEAGEAFAAVRRRAEGLTARLDEALTALERSDLETAAAAVEAARADHRAVSDWDLLLATLPVWIETTDAMISAMETIVSATRAGDPDRARRAAEAFAALGEDAAVADRALRIAIAEGGTSVSAAALGRLAQAVADVQRARAEVVGIVQGGR